MVQNCQSQQLMQSMKDKACNKCKLMKYFIKPAINHTITFQFQPAYIGLNSISLK